ncbi:MAG: hypothetical protein WC607_02910 [Candidatus Micrarchaeia archaeon]
MSSLRYLIFAALLAVLALAAASWLGLFSLAEFTGAPAQNSAQEALAFGEAHAGDFITYENANYSLKLKYPIGFYAEEEPDFYTVARFSAVSGGAAEIIDLKVAEGEYAFTQSELNEMFEDSGDLISASERVEVNGVDAWVFSATQGVNGVDFVVKGAFYDCPGYTAFVSVTMPSALAALDAPMADYVLYSFSC